jgi:hypothetical protein
VNALEVIRRVEAMGGRLVLDKGKLKLRAAAPLPEELTAVVSQEKAAIMVALGAPLDIVVSHILEDIRPHLPKTLRRLPDDRLLALVNWSIITAWGRSLRVLEGEQVGKR